jgi:hypothetical protein
MCCVGEETELMSMDGLNFGLYPLHPISISPGIFFCNEVVLILRILNLKSFFVWRFPSLLTLPKIRICGGGV